ncbi:MAG TPA: hypothetical protein VEA37_10535, partial [Flavobacterium sp.]|nr:hypothetical protein [Flavobacterium sp.]
LLITNGTIEDIKEINVNDAADFALMAGRTQMLEIIPSYGKLFFEHTLLKNASLVKSYSFEQEDLQQLPTGQNVFKNWNVYIGNAPGAIIEIKETSSFDGQYALSLVVGDAIGDPSNPSDLGRRVTLESKPFSIEFNEQDKFELSFEYLLNIVFSPGNIPHWVRIKWRLKVGSFYYNRNYGWVADDTFNELYVNTFNDIATLKCVDNFRDGVVATITETAQIIFEFEGANGRDFNNTSAEDDLRSIPTAAPKKSPGSKVKGYFDMGGFDPAEWRYYILRSGDEADNAPNIIVPDDYHALNNRVYWELETRYSFQMFLGNIFLDNVVLKHFPNGNEPPKNITVERTNNKSIKVNFEEEYLLNDIDIDNINNSERTYKNFFKKLDGTPTQVWERTYRPGQGKLLELLSNDVTSQYRTGSNKITGTLFTDKEILPTTILNEPNDADKKYMFMGYTLHDKHCTIDFDILELKDTITDPEGEQDAAFTTGFSTGFRS